MALNLAQIQLGGGVRVHHGRVIDVFGVLVHQCADCQFLHIDLGAHERRQLRWNVVDHGRLDTVGITKQGVSTAAPVGNCGSCPWLGRVAIHT